VGKKPQVYSEPQTQHKYLICCRCWYSYNQKV